MIKRIKAPKYRVGRYVLNEYELRQLQVDISKGVIKSGVKVKDIANNTIHIIGDDGRFDKTPKSYSLSYELVKQLF